MNDPAPTEAPTLVRRILLYPDPMLLRPSAPVTDFGPALVDLFDQLESTAGANDGLGLAAIQIGVPLRAIVVRKADGAFRRMANPGYCGGHDRLSLELEGCLSLPTVFEKVVRLYSIDCQYQTQTGEVMTETFVGREARCIQHELEHLDGLFFTRHFGPAAKDRARALGKKLRRRFGVR